MFYKEWEEVEEVKVYDQKLMSQHDFKKEKIVDYGDTKNDTDAA